MHNHRWKFEYCVINYEIQTKEKIPVLTKTQLKKWKHFLRWHISLCNQRTKVISNPDTHFPYVFKDHYFLISLLQSISTKHPTYYHTSLRYLLQQTRHELPPTSVPPCGRCLPHFGPLRPAHWWTRRKKRSQDKHKKYLCEHSCSGIMAQRRRWWGRWEVIVAMTVFLVGVKCFLKNIVFLVLRSCVKTEQFLQWDCCILSVSHFREKLELKFTKLWESLNL